MSSIVTTSFIRMKMEDGSYAVILPINTTDEVFIDLLNKKTLTEELGTMNLTITNNSDTVIEDLLTLTKNLYSSIQKPLTLKHISIEDMVTGSELTITSGAFIPGKIFF